MKTKKRLVPLGFIVLILGLLVAAAAGDPAGAWNVLREDWSRPTVLAEEMEGFLRENLPFREELRGGALRLRMLGGGSEQNGIFLVEEGLIPNLPVTADTTIHRGNTRRILSAIEETASSCYFMLIPTSCAIYRDKLPSYAPIYRQRDFIESTYKQFYGSAVTVDAYNALLYSDSDYLYYRTEDNLTTLGGYALYQALAPRLGFSAKPLQQFMASYDVREYYGGLCERWGYGGVRPDTITTYRDVLSGARNRVVSWDGSVWKSYDTLFPAVEEDGMGILLGGYAPRVNITTTTDRTSSLLVLGDRTAFSYLPFLAGHYQRITFLDFSLLTSGEVGSFDPDEYTQILFAYSLDGYLNTEAPAKAGDLGKGG